MLSFNLRFTKTCAPRLASGGREVRAEQYALKYPVPQPLARSSLDRPAYPPAPARRGRAKLAFAVYGTHPSLTLEPLTMLRRFGVGRAKVSSSIYGVSYKCEVTFAEFSFHFLLTRPKLLLHSHVRWMSHWREMETRAIVQVDLQHQSDNFALHNVNVYCHQNVTKTKG